MIPYMKRDTLDPETLLYPDEARCSQCYSIHYADSSCQNCEPTAELIAENEYCEFCGDELRNGDSRFCRHCE